AIMALFTGMATAKLIVATPTHEFEGASRDTEFWFDDMEGDVSAYGTTDFTVGATPHFHWDTYMAYEGTYSWWCGTFDYDADGGYGNSWDDRLIIPTLDLSAATYPILTYAFRHDSEMGYDYTYVQAESNGVFVDLNRGYDGKAPWTDIGLYGFILQTYDNPLEARFRFLSDGGWSDEDGDYLSVGGAFMCDIVKVFDYFGGAIYFYDSEPGAREDECIPAVPGAAGDFWHLIDRKCPAYSDPHSWWCGDDADTSLVPPNLQNGLWSPLVNISAAATCTVSFAAHFAIPTIDNDYVSMYGSNNGANYYSYGGWWGDFGQCDGWGGYAYNHGFDITQFGPAPYTWGGFLWIMNTTDNGCGPGGGGDAGIMIDNLKFEGTLAVTAVEESSWGSIKAMYR
ncbi:MAG: hypothetical protein KAW67_06095, partial [Candidatus Eisenbacteria sp.]|nr:hypothetical protein [Candidatus Eisenbacteria bacterium]